LRDSLAKFAPEGVWSILGHWIRNRWPRFIGRDEREREEAARRPEGRKEAAGAIAGRPELAGETLHSATELGFAKQIHREREEVAANPILALARPGKRPHSADRGGAMPESLELAARAREGTKPHGTWSRRTRGRNGPHQREDWRRRWLGTAASRGGSRRRSGDGFSTLNRVEQRQGKKKWGRGVLGCARGSPT